MAYEQLKLVYAAMSGNIFLAKIEKEGIMSTRYRREATTDVVVATMEWMIGNNRKKVTLIPEDDEPKHTLYYTSDPEKQEVIEKILGINDEQEVISESEWNKLSPKDKLLHAGYSEEQLNQMLQDYPDEEPDDLFTDELNYAAENEG